MPMNGGSVIVNRRHRAASAKRAELRLDIRDLFYARVASRRSTAMTEEVTGECSDLSDAKAEVIVAKAVVGMFTKSAEVSR
jgi:hypothetical protein